MKVRQDIEILRVLSAFGIVWFHSGAPGRAFAYSGLVIFIILSVYLSQHGNQHISTRFKIRARRLLVPWSIWFTFYGLIRLLTQKPLRPLENGAIAGVLSGPSSHLWYLPFTFVLLVIIDSARVKLPPSILAWTGYALAILAFVSWGRWSVPENPSEYLWMQLWACHDWHIFRYFHDALRVASEMASAVSSRHSSHCVGIRYLDSRIWHSLHSRHLLVSHRPACTGTRDHC